MFNLISNIKDTLGIIAVVSTLLLGWLKYNDSKKIDRLNTNLRSTTIQYQDSLGRMVTETTELRFTIKDLRSVASRDSSTLNNIEKQLWEANKEAERLGIKANRLETFNKAYFSVAKDSLITTPVYNEDKAMVGLKPIKTKHLDISFNVTPDTIFVNHKYKASITTVVSRERSMKTKKGNKRFFLARLIVPRWQYSAKNVIDDPDAVIDSAININFNKKNR